MQDTLLSPLYWTAGNRMPFALTYGEKDSARVIKSNRRVCAMLGQQGATLSMQQMGGRDHFQSHTDLRDGAHPWYTRFARLVADTAGA